MRSNKKNNEECNVNGTTPLNNILIMEVIFLISNGERIHEKYDSELTIGEISESFLTKYLPNSQSARFLYNSKLLNPDQKLSEIGYTEGKIIIVYPKPALKPKEQTQNPKSPKQEEKPKATTNENSQQKTNKTQTAEPKTATSKIPQPQQQPKAEIPKPVQQQQHQQNHSQIHHSGPSHSSQTTQQPQNQRANPPHSANMIKPDPKFMKLRELIMEDPPHSLDAVIDSIIEDDPVLGDRIKRNPKPFLALMGISYENDNGNITLKLLSKKEPAKQ